MKEKINPAIADQLTQQLRSRVRRTRWRYFGSMAIVVGVVLGAGALGLWYFAPKLSLPPLAIVAFDDLGDVGKPVRLHAQVEAIEGDPIPGYLGGFEVLFRESSQSEPTIRSTTKGTGLVEESATFPDATRLVQYVARLPGEGRRNASEDPARILLVEPGTRLLLIDVDLLTAAKKPDVWSTPLTLIQANPTLAATLRDVSPRAAQIVYLAAGSERALGYRQQRRWVMSQSSVLPTGPVLGRKTYHDEEAGVDPRRQRIAELAERFPVSILVPDATSAEEMRTLKVTPIVLDAELRQKLLSMEPRAKE